MGGWFSSDRKTGIPDRQWKQQNNNENYKRERERQLIEDRLIWEAYRELQTKQISGRVLNYRTQTQPTTRYVAAQINTVNKVQSTSHTSAHKSSYKAKLDITHFIGNLIQDKTMKLHWTNMDYEREVLKYITVDPYSLEYEEIEYRFFRSFWGNRPRPVITKIVRVQNPYLLAAYILKKEEIYQRFGTVTELPLFHGTKATNANSICKDNFNWRLHGKSLGNRFGKGVSFSPKSTYSKHYCDKMFQEKVILFVYVLVASPCIGNEEMIIPPDGYDTTQKPNGDVLVKYGDNEFYPAYKIYFQEV